MSLRNGFIKDLYYLVVTHSNPINLLFMMVNDEIISSS